MAAKLAINGFGRIGRSVMRALLERKVNDLEVIAINDPAPTDTLAHLFTYDSIHGRYRGPVVRRDDHLDLGQGSIRISHERDPASLDWPDVDLVLECSGQFLTYERAERHLRNGSSAVLLSAPAKDNTKTVVYGVNHMKIEPQDHIISNASCTTNCLVPVVDLLDRTYGIQRGMMTTVHCYTNTQPLQDAPQSDLARARAANLSMIPTTTGAAQTLGQILPELAGKITAQAIRVPVPNVSCIDLTVELRETVSINNVNDLFRDAAAKRLNGIIDTVDQPLVSIDLNHDPHSAILACDQTRVQGGNLLRVLAWYDNEWGFANRMVDTARHMVSLS